MKQLRAIQRSEYNFESTGYDSRVSQAGLLGVIYCPGCFMTLYLTLMTPTSCRADISLLGNKYSIIWNLLSY